MCRPPKPTAMLTFSQPAGHNSVIAPAAMKTAPIRGTTRTLEAPPATTALPYVSSQTPGSGRGPALASTTGVSSAPATSGAERLRANRRAGPETPNPARP